MKESIYILLLIKLLIINHLGKNPKNGGKPANDINLTDKWIFFLKKLWLKFVKFNSIKLSTVNIFRIKYIKK